MRFLICADVRAGPLRRSLASAVLVAALCAPAPARADRVDYFLKQLAAAGFKVRLQAAYILGTLGDKRALSPLVKALDDAHYAVRGAVAIALGALGDPTAIESLVKAAADEEAWVRAEVMKALGRLRASTALSTLVAALDDADWKVRYQAARSLGLCGEPGAIIPLARVIEAGIDNAEVVDAARASLRKVAPSQDTKEIEARLRTSDDKHERARAAVILGVLGDKAAVPALINSLLDNEPYVRAGSAGFRRVSGGARTHAASHRNLRAWKPVLPRSLLGVGRRGRIPPRLSALTAPSSFHLNCASAPHLGARPGHGCRSPARRAQAPGPTSP